MAPKINIHEKCKDCGVVVARIVKDGIAWNPSACTCPKGDGPPSPPRTVRFHSANFVPADSSLPMVTRAPPVDPKAETVELPVVPEIAPSGPSEVIAKAVGDIELCIGMDGEWITDPSPVIAKVIADVLRQAAAAVLCDDCESDVALHGAYHVVEFQRKGLCPAGPVRDLLADYARENPDV